MSYKWVGAILIIAACGAVGFGMAANSRREERALRQLIGAMEFMTCELQFRLTPLPELCRMAASESTGSIAMVLKRLTEELNAQVMPDVEGCVRAALENAGLTQRVRDAFMLLGSTLGRFDLDGQLQGLEAVRSFCRRELDQLSNGRDARLRSYQTLGICAGAALAILFV